MAAESVADYKRKQQLGRMRRELAAANKARRQRVNASGFAHASSYYHHAKPKPVFNSRRIPGFDMIVGNHDLLEGVI